MQTVLKRLTLRSCRSFAEPATVTFDNDGLVLVRGKNLDTGGSSGSGKSSLLLALGYAFGYAPFAATSLQSWHTDDPLDVEVEFEVDGKTAIIRRGAKTTLTIDGEVIKGSVKVVEEALKNLIGLEPELLQALTYRAQRQRSAFLAMPDADKKEFLSKVLGLERIEKLVDEATKTAKSLETELAAADGAVNAIATSQAAVKKQLEATPAATSAADIETELASNRAQISFLDETRAKLQLQVSSLSAQIQDAHKQAESKYANQVLLHEEYLRQIKSKQPPAFDSTETDRLTALLGEIKARMQAAEAKDAERKRVYDETWLQLQADHASAAAALQRSASLDAEIAETRANLTKLADNKCPTCARDWDDTDAEKEKLDKQLESLLGELQQVNCARQLVVDIKQKLQLYPAFEPNPNLAKFKEVFEHHEQLLQAERQRQNDHIHAFKAKQIEEICEMQDKIAAIRAQAAQDAAAAVDSITHSLQMTQSKLESTLTEIRGYENRCAELHKGLIEVQSKQSDRKILTEHLSQIEQQLSEARAKSVSLKTKQALELDVAHALGREGFLGSIFDEILKEIAEETNAILAAVPNTANVAFSFRTETLTQKGSTKKSITPNITVSGHEAPMASGLSGGMSTSVELAVDLAIGSVISRRSGTKIGWLLLDEAFDGLGLVEKEACLEILQKVANDRLVLVIDHDNQFKELFTSTVDVQCRNGKSSIVS